VSVDRRLTYGIITVLLGVFWAWVYRVVSG